MFARISLYIYVYKFVYMTQCIKRRCVYHIILYRITIVCRNMLHISYNTVYLHTVYFKCFMQMYMWHYNCNIFCYIIYEIEIVICKISINGFLQYMVLYKWEPNHNFCLSLFFSAYSYMKNCLHFL